MLGNPSIVTTNVPRELVVVTRGKTHALFRGVALRLRLHEGSVERHVTSLLRKAKCESRAGLVARFWTML